MGGYADERQAIASILHMACSCPGADADVAGVRSSGVALDQSDTSECLAQLEPAHQRESTAALRMREDRGPLDAHGSRGRMGPVEGCYCGVAEDAEDGTEDSGQVARLGDFLLIRVVERTCARAGSHSPVVFEGIGAVVESILISIILAMARKDCRSQVSETRSYCNFVPMVPESCIFSIRCLDTSDSFVQNYHFGNAAHRRHG